MRQKQQETQHDTPNDDDPTPPADVGNIGDIAQHVITVLSRFVAYGSNGWISFVSNLRIEPND